MKKHVVYFVQSENRLIKIGKTTEEALPLRIQNLQVAAGFTLSLVGVTKKFTEREVHHRFQEYRLRGEWFFPHISLLNFIEGLNSPRNDELAIEVKKALRESVKSEQTLPTYAEAKNAFEKQYLRTLLSETKGNVSEAARVAGKYRADLYELMRKHGLESKDFTDKGY